jgi:hypothetical protein
MRVPAQRIQQFFQLVQRGAGMADDLASAVQNMNLIETQCIYNDDVAVITAAGRRALGQSTA